MTHMFSALPSGRAFSLFLCVKSHKAKERCYMENLSLFDKTEDQAPTQLEITQAGTLNVVKMNFCGAENLSWQHLFSGFDSLHAITYSSGIGFVYRLLDLFKDAEIIFGCDEVISYSLQEIMAYQCKTIERLRETASKMKLDLVSRVKEGTLRFYVARSILSHEKIYLLSARDGRKRVIMGSANMSFSAFSGQQRENICYLDGDEAYAWYWDCYCGLRDESTDQIAKETLLYADDGDNLDELPIARTVRTRKALVLQPVADAQDEVRFSLDIKNLSTKFAPSVPKPDKKGKLMLSPEKIKSIRRQVVSNKEKEKELQSEYPQLEIFPDEKIARLNGKALYSSNHCSSVSTDSGDIILFNFVSASNADSIEPAKISSFDLLFEYLKHPEAEAVFKAQAYAYALSLLEPKLIKNSLAFNNWKVIMDAVNEQTHFTGSDFVFPETFYGSWIPRNNLAHLTIHAGIHAAELKNDGAVSVCAILHDDKEKRTDKYEQEWNGLWQFYNLMQFSDKFIAVASTGMERMDYLALPVMAAPHTEAEDAGFVVDSAWDSIEELLFDEDAKAFAEIAKDNGIPAPNEDCIGYELEGNDGEVIATVEIAWPERKIGFLTVEQLGDKSKLEDLGWRIVSLMDSDMANIFGGDNQ